MIIRSPIATPASMREAYALILDLEARYLRENRRKHEIELTLSSSSRPVYDERGRPKLSNETIEVRAVYDSGAPTQALEYQWFEREAQIAARAAVGDKAYL